MLDLKDIITPCPYDGMTSAQTTQAIAKDFNQSRPSIMTQGFNWLFQHRLVRETEFRLVEKNGIPELVPGSSTPLRREKILNFQDSSSTVGIFKQSDAVIGLNGHYVVNVPAGKYAKIFDGKEAKILDSGQHVIHSNNFRFNPATNLVDQNSEYIQHNNLHILRVPPGKLAIVRIDNVCQFLESRKEPYVLDTLQFHLERNGDELFYDANSKVLQAGTTLRLVPDIGEIGILNVGGTYNIVEADPSPVNSGRPIIRDINNGRFDGFLQKNLNNVMYPSEKVVRRHKENGMSDKEAGFYYFETSDSVKVATRLFVSYRIVNPQLALEKLQSGDIAAHIEAVVSSDFNIAIKRTSNQELQSSNLSHVTDDDEENAEYWQDRVKIKLKKSLLEKGIEVERLNLNETKINDPEIERQMARQAVNVTEANSRWVALSTNLEIARAEAEQKRELDLLRQTTENELLLTKAEGEKAAAQIKADATGIENQTQLNFQKQMVEMLSSSPQAMMLEFLKAMVKALQGLSLSSSLPVSDIFNYIKQGMEEVGIAAKVGDQRFFKSGDVTQASIPVPQSVLVQ